MDLLNKTRRISKILQKNVGHHLVDFDQVAEALCDVIGANLYVVSPEGEILGLAVNHEIENERMQKYLKDWGIEEFEVVSAGERDPDAEGAEGMRASKARQLAADGNFDLLAKALPDTINNATKKVVYNEIRKNL